MHVFSLVKGASLPAKMNRAFILRHGGLYDRQLEEEMQRSIYLLLLDCLKYAAVVVKMFTVCNFCLRADTRDTDMSF